MNDDRCTIVTVTHNSAAVLPIALNHVDSQFPVIIVDNDSKDETLDIARTAGAQIICNPENKGFGRACNQGAHEVASEYILFMNPDVEFARDHLIRLLDAADENPNAVAFGPKIVEHDGTELYRWTNFLHAGHIVKPEAAPEKTCEVLLLSGAIFLIRKSAFDEIGGFDENIFLFFEEDDLFKRLTDQGMKICYVPETVATHTAGRSSPQSLEGTQFRNYHFGWSQCYVAQKHNLPYHPSLEKWRFLRRCMIGLLTLRPLRFAINYGRFRGTSDWLKGNQPALKNAQ